MVTSSVLAKFCSGVVGSRRFAGAAERRTLARLAHKWRPGRKIQSLQGRFAARSTVAMVGAFWHRCRHVAALFGRRMFRMRV
jgi:hypothetical protein